MKRKKTSSPSEQELIEVYGKFHPRDEMPVTAVEIVPKSDALIVSEAPSANLQAAIENMVRKRVDEILSASGMGELHDPHFRPREVAQKARQVENMFERVKWSLFFDRWGCMICSKKTLNHASNGLCNNCANRITQRLRVIKRDYEIEHPEAETDRLIDNLTLRSRTAKKLLGGDD